VLLNTRNDQCTLSLMRVLCSRLQPPLRVLVKLAPFSAASRKKLFLCTAFVSFNCCSCAVGNWYDTPWFTALEASDAGASSSVSVASAFLTVTSEKELVEKLLCATILGFSKH
jgi:hypothetical protein